MLLLSLATERYGVTVLAEDDWISKVIHSLDPREDAATRSSQIAAEPRPVSLDLTITHRSRTTK
jgi:hypothetical protein